MNIDKLRLNMHSHEYEYEFRFTIYFGKFSYHYIYDKTIKLIVEKIRSISANRRSGKQGEVISLIIVHYTSKKRICFQFRIKPEYILQVLHFYITSQIYTSFHFDNELILYFSNSVFSSFIASFILFSNTPLSVGRSIE